MNLIVLFSDVKRYLLINTWVNHVPFHFFFSKIKRKIEYSQRETHYCILVYGFRWWTIGFKLRHFKRNIPAYECMICSNVYCYIFKNIYNACKNKSTFSQMVLQ